MDGEGCIYYHGHHHIRGSRIGRGTYISMVQARPREKVLYEIKEFLQSHSVKCNVYRTHSANHYKDNTSECFTLQIGQQESVATFLKMVFPELICKRDKAEEALNRIKSLKLRAGKANIHSLESAYDLYRSGCPVEKIREKTGICLPSLHLYMRRMGFPRMTQKQRWNLLPESDKERIRQNTRRASHIKSHRQLSARPIRHCLTCLKRFTKNPASRSRFCSLPCWYTHLRKH